METSIVYAIYIAAFFTGLAVLLCAYLFVLWLSTSLLWLRTKPQHRIEFAKWHWLHCQFGRGQVFYSKDGEK